LTLTLFPSRSVGEGEDKISKVEKPEPGDDTKMSPVAGKKGQSAD